MHTQFVHPASFKVVVANFLVLGQFLGLFSIMADDFQMISKAVVNWVILFRKSTVKFIRVHKTVANPKCLSPGRSVVLQIHGSFYLLPFYDAMHTNVSGKNLILMPKFLYDRPNKYLTSASIKLDDSALYMIQVLASERHKTRNRRGVGKGASEHGVELQMLAEVPTLLGFVGSPIPGS